MILPATQIASRWLPWLIAALLVIAGWIAIYVAAQRKLKRAIADLRREMNEQISAAIALARTTQAQAPEEGARKDPLVPLESKAETNSAAEGDVTPEVLVVIAAAVTAFLGKKVRIRSAKLLQTPYELINPWAQQGRVVIQASHNLTARAHWGGESQA